MPSYEAVIGLEVHAQLSTNSKMFCGCSARFGGAPNTQVCPVCLGLPGALPVVNARAIEFGVRMGVATNCSIAPESIFSRKNYFYPDCPKDYQISQFDTPLCENGYLVIDGEGRRIGIKRIHLEEDAGKLVHAEDADHSFVDMNRSGVPLIEIVSEPDIRTTQEAGVYLQKVRSMVRYLQICDGNMEEGSLRCDVNISVRPQGTKELGVRTEVKNLNSIKQVEHSLRYEFDRQVELIESGGRVTQDTLLWDAEAGSATIMRSKEEAHDYRYFPEPDLLVLRADRDLVDRVASQLPELPDARRQRFVREHGIPEYDAGVLTASRDVADYFEAVTAAGVDAKAASNWVMGEVMRELNERRIDIAAFPLVPEVLAGLVRFQSDGRINSSTARDVFAEMVRSGESAADIISARGLEQISDEDAIETAAAGVLDKHPDEVGKYLGGKEKLLTFFVGQLMKVTRGKANPEMAAETFKRLLEERR